MITPAEAIAIIQSSRQSHVSWLEWYAKYPAEEAKHTDTAGDRAWQQKAIDGYDKVLELLEHVRLQGGGK